MDDNLARKGGPVRKQSYWLKCWRERWLAIEWDRVVFYSEEKADGSAFSFNNSERAGLAQASILRRETAAVGLALVSSAFAVSNERFNRESCFILCTRGGRDMIGLQAPDEAQRTLLLQAIQTAISDFAERSAIANPERGMTAKEEAPAPVPVVEYPLHPPPPAKPKMLGTAPAPPPPKAKGKAPPPPRGCPQMPKAGPKVMAKSLPINRKLQLRGMDKDIDLTQTVFGAMLDDNDVSDAKRNSSSDESGSDRMADLFREAFTPRAMGERAQRATSAIERRRAKKAESGT
jgi:hypothetical protein